MAVKSARGVVADDGSLFVDPLGGLWSKEMNVVYGDGNRRSVQSANECPKSRKMCCMH